MGSELHLGRASSKSPDYEMTDSIELKLIRQEMTSHTRTT